MSDPTITIQAADAEVLGIVAGIPIAFTVESRYRVERSPLGLNLVLETVEPPWAKDYDAIRGEGPTRWATTFDLTNWVVLTATSGSRLAGAATVAFKTEGLHMLRGRDDLACLWDLRVHPDHRGTGVGTRLFEAAGDWSREQGATELVVETQNINVPACRFYTACGAELTAIIEHAYAELPDEVELLYTITL